MIHKTYIKRCLQIAENGIGTSRPNPSVGAVIVCKNKIIGEGFTSPFGGMHAEVNAINSVLDKNLLKYATLYVSLEPCAHIGKTPPCVELIVKYKFKNVVIGCLDTNSLVAGKGIKYLESAGVNVFLGVLENQCLEHHRRFFTVHNKKRPYIILKWAETINGFIAPHTKEDKSPVWLSNQYSQQLVHKLRSKEHAILVGTNTVLEDNPRLNIRNWSGEDPVKIIIDRTLRIPTDAKIFDNSTKTIIITQLSHDRQEYKSNIVLEQISFSNNFAIQICEILQKHKIQSLIVEGGSKTLKTFIDADIWDEAMVFIGDINLNQGVKAPLLLSKKYSEINIKNDFLKLYKND